MGNATSEAKERTDSERLDALEKFINTWGGILLHIGKYAGDIRLLPYPGLALKPGLANPARTLRETIDGSLFGSNFSPGR